MIRRPLLVGLIVTVSLLFSSCGILEATGMKRVEEESEQKLNGDNITSIDVSSSVGSTKISTWDKNEVYIKATKTNSGYKSMNELTEELKDAEVVVKEENGTLEVKAYLPKFKSNGMSVALDISVPEKLQKYSIKSEVGDVRVKGASGEINISNSVGKIEVEDSTGKMDIRAATGDLSVENSTLKSDSRLSNNVGKVSFDGKIDSKDTIRISNDVGKIDIALPGDAAFELEASTNIGSIDCDFNVNGKVDENEVEGKVNDGGLKLVVKNNTGSIDINKR